MQIKEKNQLINYLFEAKIISFSVSPYIINLRRLSSYPAILKFAAKAFGEEIKKEDFDIIAGPFTDIPLATTISLEFNWPMVFVREERKDHGTERLIEGNYQTGQRVIVIDDEIEDVAGSLQLLGRLEGSGLKIAGVYVLLDRGYGAIEAVAEKGYHCQAIISLNDIFLNLAQTGKISSQQLDNLKKYLEEQRKEFLIKLSSNH